MSFKISFDADQKTKLELMKQIEYEMSAHVLIQTNALLKQVAAGEIRLEELPNKLSISVEVGRAGVEGAEHAYKLARLKGIPDDNIRIYCNEKPFQITEELRTNTEQKISEIQNQYPSIKILMKRAKKNLEAAKMIYTDLWPTLHPLLHVPHQVEMPTNRRVILTENNNVDLSG